MKLDIFLIAVNLIPNSFISRGMDVKPIIVRLVINAAPIITLAPFSIREATNGNETKAGMYKMAPIRDARRMPEMPDFSPRYSAINLFGINPCMMPIITIVIMIYGAVLTNDLNAIFTTFDVFSFDLKNEMPRATSTKRFKIRKSMAILNPHDYHIVKTLYTTNFILAYKNTLIRFEFKFTFFI